MKIVVRDQRNGSWYWISRVIYQKYASKIGAIGLAVYNAYASYAFEEQKVFPSQSTIAKKLHITQRTLIKYNAILEAEKLIQIESGKEKGKVNIVNLLRAEGMNEVHRGYERGSQGGMNEVHTNKNNTNKKNLIRIKNKYTEFVYLTKEEYNKLVAKFGKIDADEKIAALNDGIGSKGYRYKSHYHTILAWARKDKKDAKYIDHTNRRASFAKQESSYGTTIE